jgi:putative colanic acid biosynthesis acetyltransferase WcaF
MSVDLLSCSSTYFDRGASIARELIWLVVSLILFRFCPFSFSPLKRTVLRIFGTLVEIGVTIKPQIKIAFPWKQMIGDHVWLGEEYCLLDLERIIIGNNLCISQCAFLCTGGQNYKAPLFDFVVKPIIVEEGSWICASAWFGPGVTVETHAVLMARSVASSNFEPYGVYRGNPVVFVRRRKVSPIGAATEQVV